jgi:hypothetical protein
MSKDNTITIDGNDFAKGIGASPLVGNGLIQHANITDLPGALIANGKCTENTFDTAPTDHIVAFDIDTSTGNIYALDAAASLFSVSGTAWTKITGNTAGIGLNLVVWGGCVFVFKHSAIDVYKISSTTWTNSWSTGASYNVGITGNVPAVKATDGGLYIGLGNEVDLIEVNAGYSFDPANTDTYTYSNAVLRIPAYYKIKTMVQHNNMLVLGTWVGLAVYDQKIADIFYWNFEGSDGSWDSQINLRENGVHQMISVNGLLYVVAGINGNIYVTDLNRAEKIATLGLLPPGSASFIIFEPNAIMYHKGKIYFAGYTASRPTTLPIGIYSLDINNGNVLNYENTMSTGEQGATANLFINALFSAGSFIYYIGYTDYTVPKATRYKIDRQNGTEFYIDDSVVFISRVYKVGTRLNKKTFQSFEFELLNKVNTPGQGIAFYYRESPGDSWVQIGSKIQVSTSPNFDGFFFPFSPSLKSIQIKAAIDETSSVSDINDMVALKTITIK